jgi:serine protease
VSHEVAKKQNARRRIRQSRLSVRTSAGRQPKLEALSVLLDLTPGRDAHALARALARRLRLTDWRIELVTNDGVEWEIVPPSRNVGAPRAWDLTYALRAQPEVTHAAPLFRYLVPENAERRGRKASGGGAADDPATDTDYEWSLRKANVLEAWKLFGARPPGEGVQVGHPDTGYTLHPELAEPARLLIAAGYDYDDNDDDPLDDLNDDFLDNPGHGTGTGSVILSGVGGTSAGSDPFVSGVAPHALLIPIRTTESVVLFAMRGLRQAVDHAAAHGAHVVSISLGGPFPGFGTRRAIARAVEVGTIVLAAAGNGIGIVVFPAAFDEVIAVAASNVRDKPWSGSSHGPAVDITAPGESVWRAKVERDTAAGLQYLVTRGNGTSFAVATAAGVAALWISYHGWTTLVRRYGMGNVPRVFKQMLQSTCRTPRGWDTAEYGPGIIDARRLLEMPLPATAPARKLRDSRRAAVATDTTGIETLVHLLPDVPRTRVEELIADLLHVPDRALPSVLQDYGEELAFQLAMQPALLDTLRKSARGGKAAATSRRVARRRLMTSGVSSSLRKRLAAK